jgi:hypothetical protein
LFDLKKASKVRKKEGVAMEVKMTGWKAVVAIGLILGFVGFRYVSQSKEMESQGKEVVQQWLIAKQARLYLPEMQKAMEDPQKNAKKLERMANELTQNGFKVISMTRRGMEEAIVRVEYQVEGKSPQTVYLRMEHSLVSGWRIINESSKIQYILALF